MKKSAFVLSMQLNGCDSKCACALPMNGKCLLYRLGLLFSLITEMDFRMLEKSNLNYRTLQNYLHVNDVNDLFIFSRE